MPPSPKFWNRAADKYYRDEISDMASYEKKLEMTRSYLKPDMDVLEFGCGTGGTAVIHAPYVNSILGVDISERMLDYARDRVTEAGIENVTFQCSAIDDLDVPAASKDMVLGLSILHLLENKEAVIAKIYDTLKPGGLFVSSTVCLGDGFKFLIPIIPVARAVGLFPVVKVFTADNLRAALTNAGFTIEHDWCPGKRKAVFIVARKPG